MKAIVAIIHADSNDKKSGKTNKKFDKKATPSLILALQNFPKNSVAQSKNTKKPHLAAHTSEYHNRT